MRPTALTSFVDWALTPPNSCRDLAKDNVALHHSEERSLAGDFPAHFLEFLFSFFAETWGQTGRPQIVNRTIPNDTSGAVDIP